MNDRLENIKICVVGLGYVGLPLACLFASRYPTVGFDINQARVDALRGGHDATLEVDDSNLMCAMQGNLTCSSDVESIRGCNVYVVTVPTPVDLNNHPDLRPLVSASTTVGKVLDKGDVVIYESTVYPGVTEEVCIPVVERSSGLCCNRDFFVGYSPERVNPGDKEHDVASICKVAI